MNVFFRETLAFFRDKSLWSGFPDAEDSSSRRLKVCMRPAAVIHQLVAARTAGFPYRMFSLLSPGIDVRAQAAELLSTPLCLLDDWSKKFLEVNDTEAKLSSPEALCELEVLAEVALCNTVSTERAHSKNLRRAATRHQTQKADLRYIALTHLGHSAPASSLRAEAPRKLPSASKRKGRPPKQSSSSAPVAKVKGGGGAWRAFVHHNLAGGRKLTGQNIRELSDAYRRLTAEELLQYQRLGQLGA